MDFQDKFTCQQLQKVKKRREEYSGTFSFTIVEIIILNFAKKMNISFAEKMMGYPEGWTDLVDSETQ